MTIGLIVTMVLFVAAITMIIAANFAIRKYTGDWVPNWMQEYFLIVCIIVIMATLYHFVGYVWGVYEFPEHIQRILK